MDSVKTQRSQHPRRTSMEALSSLVRNIISYKMKKTTLAFVTDICLRHNMFGCFFYTYLNECEGNNTKGNISTGCSGWSTVGLLVSWSCFMWWNLKCDTFHNFLSLFSKNWIFFFLNAFDLENSSLTKNSTSHGPHQGMEILRLPYIQPPVTTLLNFHT